MDAFDKLYRSNVSRIYALAWRLSGDSVLAEELTQDVFVRAWEKLPSFRGDSAFSTWLYPITINVALSERRSRLRRTAHVEPVEDLSSFEGPKDRDHEAGFDLEKAIAKLPQGARSIFVLHDVEGYRHEEIADLTGVAAGTSKAQLHRARKLLREALGR
jgi:RNA polymerase sigma-70 factor (ECF subfamily)